jgi:hypothetical protein
MTDADCCNGQCLMNSGGMLVCTVPCVATSGQCTFSAECCGECCSGNCATTCQPPIQ